MKKLLLLLFAFCAISCRDAQPIERYKGNGLVLIETPLEWNGRTTELILKNKDSIFNVYVHPFDAVGLKVGDTLK